MLESPTPPELDPAISLRPEEKIRRETKLAWNGLLASVPVPALWITAHVDLSATRPSNAALDDLQAGLMNCNSSDSIADLYRIFLQKFLTPLNRKILKSRSQQNTFRFLGSLERNTNDPTGKQLHYHFFLWDPSRLFLTDHTAMQRTADLLKDLWLKKVNDKISARYKPIDIQFVYSPEDTFRLCSYMNKANHLTQSYELFDDWSTSRLKY